jgi:protein-S-isoprenylcysteine O-methyltransferase Ste14
VGLLLVWIGFSMRTWALATLLREGISEEDIAVPKQPKQWTTKGPYRWMRHPAYWGSLCVLSGAGIGFLGWGGFVLALPAWPFFAARMAEEKSWH